MWQKLVCPLPEPQSAALAPPPVDDGVLINAIILYIGTIVCLTALVLTRQAYKLSPGFRTRLAATGFHALPEGSTSTAQAAVMSAIFREAWPATVSEMLQDTGAAHGMVFLSLMVAGCLACLQCDFAALAPVPLGLPAPIIYGIRVVHLLRRLIFCFAIGFWPLVIHSVWRSSS